MGEHVGDGQYPAFGALLIQQMARAERAPGAGAFIEAYIAPDMHMRPVGQTVSLLEDAGLGGAPAFEDGRMGVHQMLAIRS